MGSTFKGMNLFGSGPHVFEVEADVFDASGGEHLCVRPHDLRSATIRVKGVKLSQYHCRWKDEFLLHRRDGVAGTRL